MDERVGRAIVLEGWLGRAFKLGHYSLGQHLSKLNAPLIERVDVPDRALGEHAVLVQRDERAERFRSQSLGQDRGRRAIPLEDAMRHEPLRRSLCSDLLGSLPKRQCFGLCDQVRNQQVVMMAEWIQWLTEANEVARDQLGPLMDKLIERMLAVRTGLSPEDWPGLVAYGRAIERHALAITLHRELLQVGGEAFEILVIREHRDGLRAEEVIVPDDQQPHQHRQIPLEWRSSEMLIHRVEPGKHCSETFG